MNRSHFPVEGVIVKLPPMSIPSRTKWGIDKLGQGEAKYFPFTDKSPVQAIHQAISQGRKSWAKGKVFRCRTDPIKKVVMVYREV